MHDHRAGASAPSMIRGASKCLHIADAAFLLEKIQLAAPLSKVLLLDNIEILVLLRERMVYWLSFEDDIAIIVPFA